MATTKFVLNETSYFGNGAREVLAEEIKKRGFKKVFLVSDKSLVEAGVTAKVEEELRKAEIPYDLYSEIKPNPTIKNVLDGVDACRAYCCCWRRLKYRYSKRYINSYDKPRKK